VLLAALLVLGGGYGMLRANESPTHRYSAYRSGVVPRKEEANNTPCTAEYATTEVTAIKNALVEDMAGEVICLKSGTFLMETASGKNPADQSQKRTGYVTIRPAPAAEPVVEGAGPGTWNIGFDSYLRFEHLRFIEGLNVEDTTNGRREGYRCSGHIEILHDTFEEPHTGFRAYGSPCRGEYYNHIKIEWNYFHDPKLNSVGKEGREGECSSGVESGQSVTIAGEGVTIAHNTFYEAQWHYIQGGGNGPEGMRVESNLFAGMDPYECTHLNIWQIFGSATNNYFRNNIVVGRGTGHKVGPFKNGTQLASTDILEFENGAGASECNVKIKNTYIENNLFVDAGGNSQLWTMEGATTNYNTIVNLESYFATGLGTVAEGHCGPSTNLTATHNIAATLGPLTMGEVTGSSTFDYNVTTGASANANGSLHYVVDWSPAWETTTWPVFEELTKGVHFPRPPTGYYKPVGLTFAAGYHGNIGL